MLTTVAGTGVCGSAGQGGPLTGAELWNPVAVALDRPADLLVADSGDQSVLLASAAGGTYWGTAVGAGDIGVVVGGTGDYGPYSPTGWRRRARRPSSTTPAAVAVGSTGALFVSDGFMQAVRVVPETTGTLLGRHMVADSLNTAVGAVPVSSSAGLGDGTKWVVTRVGTPVGVAVSGSGALYVSDAGLGQSLVGGDVMGQDPDRRAGPGGDQPTPLPGLVGRGGRRGRAGRHVVDTVGSGGRHGRDAPIGRLTPAATAVLVDHRRHVGRPHAPRTSPSTGRSSPVGVDPDDCSFAWTLDAPGRNVTQTAYRVSVRRTDPGHAATVWDSGPSSPPSRRSSPTPARRWPPTPPTAGPCGPRRAPETWGPTSRPGPVRHRSP